MELENEKLSKLVEMQKKLLNTTLAKNPFPKTETRQETDEVEKNEIEKIKSILQFEYFYTESDANKLSLDIYNMDKECYNTFINATPLKYVNLAIKNWNIKKLLKSGIKLPECYLYISNLRKDFAKYNLILKGKK